MNPGTWAERYYGLAKHISSWSKDPKKQVGAVITEDNYVRGIGFNGFPRAIADSLSRLHNPDVKNKLMVHAEMNALNSAQGRGDTIYIYPCLPCPTCAGLIMQAGIVKIVTGPPKPDSKWDITFVQDILNEAKIEVLIIPN